MFSEPAFDVSDRIFLSDPEKYEAALRKGVKLFQLGFEQGLNREQLQYASWY